MLLEVVAMGALMQSAPATYKVAPFLHDRTHFYTTEHGLPDNTVYAIAVSGEWVWAGTPKGLARAPLNNPQRWERVGEASVRWLVPDGQGTVFWANPQMLGHSTRGVLWQGEGVIGIASARDGGVWVLTETALHHWQEGIKRTLVAPERRVFRWMHEDTRGRLYAYAEGELERRFYRWQDGEWRIVPIKDNRGRFYDDYWLCATSDAVGHLWIGGRSGLILNDGEGWYLSREVYGEAPTNPIAELIPPYGMIRCLAFAPNGDLWAGTPEGACRLRDGRWSYFWGKRWLPDNRIHAIAVDSQNRAWIATEGGVACIESVPMTLRQKAEHYEKLIALRHNRNGFVFSCVWEDPSKPDEWKIEASDNDGLWTALYCAAQCFQYAATKDPSARQRARQSMQALLKLEALTGIPGFPARSIIHKSETRYIQSRGEWHESPVDPNYIWKGDTSSDELDGHYFIWAIYYDLVADEAEKEAIRGVVRRVTDHLMQNNWRLIDKDGKPTRWAIFNPEAINDDPIWEEERGLNALSILSHLKVAYHITGDAKYQQAYESLIQKHHYLINAITQKMLAPFEINHSDDELAFLCYYPFLLYEQDPTYRRMWLMSLERSWQIERPERSPLFNFIYGAITGKPCDVENAVRTLQEWPLDLRNWECRNSHRLDITLDTRKGRFGEWQSVEVLPYSERPVMRWNGNPYRLDGGDPLGREEDDGTAFLLPYWMGIYHRLIQEE
ncbi:MAG: hypothetical protein K6U12_08335 [Armatimonadetes bacterium]|nr:hypothetical protein [Armatimonadota bacterium]